jgi:hypothetical protein
LPGSGQDRPTNIRATITRQNSGAVNSGSDSSGDELVIIPLKGGESAGMTAVHDGPPDSCDADVL